VYGKHFESMYTGSMFGKGPMVFAVWGYVISHTKQDGHIELNPLLLAAVIGCDPSEVETAINFLCQSDDRSRSKDEEGRRMIREGEFDYRVVNYVSYRNILNEEERRAYNREKQRESRARKEVKKQEKIKSSSSERPGFVYYAQSGDQVKIGFSDNPWARVHEFKTANPDIELLGVHRGTPKRESEIHHLFQNLHIKGEWFRAAPELTSHIMSNRQSMTVNDTSAVSAHTDTNTSADTDTDTKQQPLANLALVPTRDSPIVAKDVVATLKAIQGESIAEEQRLSIRILTVFSYWVAKFHMDNARTKLSHGRWDRLAKFLKLYDLETLLYAIDGAKIHPHMNQEGKEPLHAFEAIFMNKPEGAGRVEKLSEYARKRDKRPKHRYLAKHPELEALG